MKKTEKIDLIESAVISAFETTDSLEEVVGKVYSQYSTQVRITEIASLVSEIAVAKKLIKTPKEKREDCIAEINVRFPSIENEHVWNIDYPTLIERIEIIQYGHPDILESFIRGAFRSLAALEGFALPKKPRRIDLKGWKKALAVSIGNNLLIEDEELQKAVLPHVKGQGQAEYYVKEYGTMIKEAIRLQIAIIERNTNGND